MKKYKITARGSRLLVNDDAMAVDVNHADLAQLLAAAPKMLEMLHSLVFEADLSDGGDAYMEISRETINEARAVIAKVKGRRT